MDTELLLIQQAFKRLEELQILYNISEIHLSPITDALTTYKHKRKMEMWRNAHS